MAGVAPRADSCLRVLMLALGLLCIAGVSGQAQPEQCEKFEDLLRGYRNSSVSM